MTLDIHYCKDSPCKNGGTCQDKIADYTCVCDIGYTGINCGIDIDYCSGIVCDNGGSCVDGINKYTCNCVDGYGGELCANG